MHHVFRVVRDDEFIFFAGPLFVLLHSPIDPIQTIALRCRTRMRQHRQLYARMVPRRLRDRAYSQFVVWVHAGENIVSCIMQR